MGRLMPVAKGVMYDLDDRETGRNANCLIIGGSGTGKTRSIISPNILSSFGSYIVSDPKGELYKRYAGFLQGRGYIVKRLDFTTPRVSDRWNPLSYLHGPVDCMRLANLMAWRDGAYKDTFWNEMNELVGSAALGLIMEKLPREERNLTKYAHLIKGMRRDSDTASGSCLLDQVMEQLPVGHWAVNQYFMAKTAPDRTWNSIAATMAARARLFQLPEVSEMLAGDDIGIEDIGKRKTAVFVIVSDTDRTMDPLANLFFTQAMHVLTREADKEPGGRLPFMVRFILDDFATNVTVTDFPEMISSIRSRRISIMAAIQAESQLMSRYGTDWRTIEGNCDTIVYLGGADLETARTVAARAGKGLREILNMPPGRCWIFRRGEEPREAELWNLEEWMKSRKIELTPFKEEGSEWLREALSFMTEEEKEEQNGQKDQED